MAESTSVNVTEPIGDWVWRLPVPMPAGHWLSTSNVYVIADAADGIHLVDSGWDTEPGWEALRYGLGELGHEIAGVRSVTLTHLHQDHRGLANRIRQSSGATVSMHRADAVLQDVPRGVTSGELDAWGVPEDQRQQLLDAEPKAPAPTHVDGRVEDGDLLDIPGRTVRVVHTPGHSPGSICLALPEQEALITGDHILPDTYPGVGLSPFGVGDPLADYFTSLHRLASMRAWRGLPGHGGEIGSLGERIDAIIEHQLRRGADARTERQAHPETSVWQVALGLRWGPGWQGLKPWHRVSALRQTAMHLQFDPSHVGQGH